MEGRAVHHTAQAREGRAGQEAGFWSWSGRGMGSGARGM